MANAPVAPKPYSGLVFFERGYRPFFLGAALFVGIAIPLWVVTLETGEDIVSGISSRDYHVHEMIFGYLSAVFAGFLLTALPNWTNRPAIAGLQLALLSLLWLLGRIAMVTSTSWPLAAAIIDASFLVVIVAIAWKEVILGGSIRNYPVCLIISLLAVANIAFHYALVTESDTAMIERMSLGVPALLISLVGGRVVPNFSGNWMKQNGISPLPAAFSKYDMMVMAATAITLGSWIMLPDDFVTGLLFSGLSLLHLIRLYRWRGWQTGAEPLVLILHVGYFWLPLWFGLSGLAILAPEYFSASSALHALTAGAIGTMTVAIMTRAILGHSGRKLHAGSGTQTIYVMIIWGALMRVFAEVLPFDYLFIVSASGTLWAGGFIVFVVVYGPYCLKKKIADYSG